MTTLSFAALRLAAADNVLVLPTGTTTVSGSAFSASVNSQPAISGSTGSVLFADNIMANTTGTFSSAVRIAGGGQATIASSTLSTQKDIAPVVQSTGTGSFVTLNNINISSLGSQSHGVDVQNGAQAFVNGGTISVAGSVAYALNASGAGSVITGSGLSLVANTQSSGGAQISSGGVLNLTDSTIRTTSTPGYAGVSLSGGTATLTNVNVANTGQALRTTNGATAFINGGTYTSTAAESMLIMLGTANISNVTVNAAGANGYGIDVNTGSRVLLNNVIINTTGVNGHGIWGVSTGTALTGSNIFITTAGSGAHGVIMQGQDAVLDNISVNTTGAGAYGIYTENNLTLSNINVRTSGSVSVGVADFGDLVTIAGGTVATIGSSGYGYYVAQSSTLFSNNVTINTTGGNARAVYAYGGVISLNGDNVTTTGATANGLQSVGTFGTISATNVTITTNGNSANAVFSDTSSHINLSGTTNITTAGVSSAGLLANAGAQIRNDGTLTITLNGASSSGVNAQQRAQIDLGANTTINAKSNSGIVSSSSASVTGSNIYISTNGGSGQNAVFANSFSNIVLNSGTIRSTGSSMWTLLVGGTATLQVNDLDVLATGNGATGLIADVGGTATVNRSKIVTTGSGAYAANSFSTAGPTYIIANDTLLSTSGNGSYAAFSQSANSFIILNGGTLMTTGSQANGIVANLTAVASATNTTVTTAGYNSYGAYAITRGTIALNAGSVTTQGDTSHALYANGVGSVISSTSTQVSTSGSSAIGVVAAGLGLVRLNGVIVNTTGVNGRGLVISGSGSDIQTDANTTVTTTGSMAHGIQVQSGATKTYDGTAGNILPTITVYGDDAAVLNATGTGSQLTLKNTALSTAMTAGPNTWGVKADTGARITLNQNFTSGGAGIWSANSGTTIVLANAATNGSRTRVDAGSVFDITQALSGVTIGSLEGAGLVSLGANTLTVGGTTTTADSASTLFSGTLNGTGSLIKQGVGVLTLSGNDAFAYTGNTTINGGVLAIRNIGITSAFTKTITLNGGWLDLSDMPGFAATPADGNNPNTWDNLTLVSGTGAQGANATGGIIGANDKITYDVASGTAASIDYAIGSATQNVEPGVDKRGIYVVKTGAGTLTLTGSNAYIGNTRVENGILQITQDANLGDVTAAREVVLGNQTDTSSSGTLQVSGNINSARAVELRQNATITVDDGFASSWGAINPDLDSSAHILTKNGNGALAFTGAAKLSGLVVNAGLINLGPSATISATADNAAAITMNSGSAVINGGTVNNTSGDLIVATSGSASSLTLANVNAQAASGANLVRITNGSDLVLTASNARLNGDITADAASHGVIFLRNNSVLTGKIDPIDADIDATSTWNLTASSSIGALKNEGRINFAAPTTSSTGFRTLTVASITGSTGSIFLNTELGDDNSPTDRLIVTGNASGSTKLLINNTDGVGAATTGKGIQIVNVGGQNTNGDATFQLGNLVTAGAYRYDLVLDPDNSWYLRNAGLNPIVGPTIDTAAAAGLNWFTQMDNLHKRMGDLRLTANASGTLLDNTWVRFSGQRMTAQLPLEGVNSFSQTDYGVDAGIDHAWRKKSAAEQSNVYYTGLFVGANTSDRNFGDGYTGSTDNVHAGLYATWINSDGWYADLVGKVSYDRHHIDGSQNAIRYNAHSEGVSLEFGRQFKRANSWWVEPSLQVTNVWSNGTDYDSTESDSGNTSRVSITDARINEYRGLVRFGREWKDSRWYPYAKIGATYLQTHGGELTFADKTFDANLDGWNIVVGLGTQYAISRYTQVYLDYEYDKSSHFERPWVINLGWRKMW